MKYSNKKWNDVVCKAHNEYVCMKNSQSGEVLYKPIRKCCITVKLTGLCLKYALHFNDELEFLECPAQ